MTKLYLPEHELILLVLSVGAWLAAGALIGACHFLTLRWNVRMFAAGQSLLAGIGNSARSGSRSLPACLPSSPVISAPCHCSSPPPASCLRGRPSFDLECGRDWIAPGHEDFVHVGPVPITEPVVVTWGLMAALALGGWLATRSLDGCAVAQPNGARGHRGRNRRSDSRHHACRASALPAAARYAVCVHPRGELVLADSRHRAPDGPHRNGCGTCADRVFLP